MNFSLGKGKKPNAVAAVFGDSSDEEDAPAASKKGTTPPAKPAVSASDISCCADKLAEWVAKNGRQFEDLTRSKNPGETPFKFLHDKASQDYAYYNAKVQEWEVKLGKATPPVAASTSAAASAPAPTPTIAVPPVPPPAYAPYAMPAPYPSPYPAPPSASLYPSPSPYPASPYAPAAPYAPTLQIAYAPSPYAAPPAPFPAASATAGIHPGSAAYASHAQAPPAPQPAAPWHQPAAQPPPPPPPQPPLPGPSQHAAPHPGYSRDREWERDAFRERASRGDRERGSRDRDCDFGKERLSMREREREESRSRGSYFLQIREVEAEMARSCQAAGDSVAAMDAYMKLAAKKDRLSKLNEEELEEERRKARPEAAVLNETSFDRRRVTAVYKQDGGRGHHMQDFIPPEELAKLAAKSGDKAAAEALEKKNAIGSNNIGHKMLSKMGWKEGQSLGATQAGTAITTPIMAGVMNQEKSGLGAGSSTEEAAGDDDPFEAYRKRMMLGYKYRPNPLGNPRKQYY